MPALCLLIPDTALRDAVTEQLVLQGYNDVRSVSDAAAALNDDDMAALIMDEDAGDKKNLKALNDLNTARKKRVFILGELKNDASGLPTESFVKPLRLGHLLSRLQFYLNASTRLRDASFRFGPYKFEPQNRQITQDDSDTVIRLTEKETAVLDYIGQSATPVTRDELLAAIWGYDARIDTHTLETHMYQLRRKLDPAGCGENWLLNENGAYRLLR